MVIATVMTLVLHGGSSSAGSALSFYLDGLTHGVDYGAFDVGDALLDGNLDVVFGFPPGSSIFDLIVTESSSGIVGDFDTVNFIGLDPNTVVSAGIELDDFGNGNVEVYRVRVGDAAAAVPEPSTALLFAAGVALLVVGRRTGRRWRSVTPR